MIEQGCKLIVIACNTVTAVAIENFRTEYKIPFVGMEPAIKPAARQTKSKKIGVLATENTFKGNHFKSTHAKYAKDVEVVIQPGHGLVELVERGDLTGEKAKTLLKKYLTPMVEKGVDTLVLGCTHYPFLKESIAEITGDSLSIIDPADAVAVQTKRVLESSGLLSEEKNDPQFFFYTTGEKSKTDRFLSTTINHPYALAQVSF